MQDRFDKYNTENELFRKEDKLLVTVSGGVDSIVLCHLLKKLDLHFAIAHCNFGLRGEESDKDEAFVEELAEELEVSIHIKKFDTYTYSKDLGISIQMAARELRYKWFHELSIQKDYIYILTAHHQNDLIETVLLNLVRGTGIAGLHGILPKSGKLVRPLLFATKEEILQYAKDHKLNWREDSSNESTKYYRNLIRLEVIPLLKKINPNLENTLQQSIEKISAAETIFNNYIEGCRMDFVTKNKDHISIDYKFLKEESEPHIILFELLRPFGFNYTQSLTILENLDQDAGSKYISTNYILVKDRNALIITKKNEKNDLLEKVYIEEGAGYISIPWNNCSITINTVEGFVKSANSTIAYLDYKKLKFPLIIRPWKTGDSFHPLGSKGRKNISDLLNDSKIPLNLKQSISVLVSDNKIVWVIGMRIDEEYKAEENEKSLKFSLN